MFLAQRGEKHPSVKPLRGRKELSGGVLVEVVADFDGDTYRAIYTAKLGDEVYVLDAFQKKSHHGIATSQQDIGRIVKRLKDAQALQARRSKQGKTGP